MKQYNDYYSLKVTRISLSLSYKFMIKLLPWMTMPRLKYHAFIYWTNDMKLKTWTGNIYLYNNYLCQRHKRLLNWPQHNFIFSRVENNAWWNEPTRSVMLTNKLFLSYFMCNNHGTITHWPITLTCFKVFSFIIINSDLSVYDRFSDPFKILYQLSLARFSPSSSVLEPTVSSFHTLLLHIV